VQWKKQIPNYQLQIPILKPGTNEKDKQDNRKETTSPVPLHGGRQITERDRRPRWRLRAHRSFMDTPVCLGQAPPRRLSGTHSIPGEATK
jgi:hypothetical protein